MKTTQCKGCGQPMLAKTVRKQWCSDVCRIRSRRTADGGSAGGGTVVPITAGGLYAAVLAEVDELGKLATIEGQQALSVARMLDATGTSAGASSLSRELGRLMGEIRGRSPSGDLVDELRGIRDRKRAETRARLDPLPGVGDIPTTGMDDDQ